jgi:hypothetical protein
MQGNISNAGVIAVKHPNLLLQMAAFLSSVLLIGGFVSYRAGAFDRYLGREAAAPAEVESTPVNDPELFYSSKSGRVFSSPPGSSPDHLTTDGLYRVTVELSDPGKSQQSPPAGTRPAPVILPGSKSLAPLVSPAPPSKPGTQAPATTQPSTPNP